MDKHTFEAIKQRVGPEKTFIGDGYYRLRQLDNGDYEFAFLLAGPCGDTTIHPQITLDATGDHILPIKLLDLGVSPTLRLGGEQHSTQLNQALNQLVQRLHTALEEK